MRNVIVVLPDIRSTYNTGSFFRTADAAGVSKILLTGFTATPPHPHILKVSLGAEKNVPWEYCEDTATAIRGLRDDGFQIVGVEQTPNSLSYATAEYATHVALVFGNEVEGMQPSILSLCDRIVDIPMRGCKESLNVSVAGGIILYHVAR